MREVVDALLPDGAFWEPAEDGDFDHLLDGIADNSAAIKADLASLAGIRDPLLTPILSDLELEYGVIPTTGATEDQRREQLAAIVYNRQSTGAWDYLQAKLRAAGFTDVYVHENSPAVDPAIFLEQAFYMTCGDILPSGNDAQCGEPEAYAAVIGGELLVNGMLLENMPDYTVQCGDGASCGDGSSAGDFSGYRTIDQSAEYDIPTDTGYWPLIFFVGGAAQRDPITGEIAEVQTYSVPQQRRSEFRSIILRLKPMHSWAGLIVAYN